MGQRHAGRQNERSETSPVCLAKIAGGYAFIIGAGNALRIVVLGNNLGTALLEGQCSGNARTAETEQSDVLAPEGTGWNQSL